MTAQEVLRNEVPAKMWRHISGDTELVLLRAMHKYAEKKVEESKKECTTEDEIVEKGLHLFKKLREERKQEHDIIREVTGQIILSLKGAFTQAEYNAIPDEQAWEDLEDEWFDYLFDKFVEGDSNKIMKLPIGGAI